MRMNRNEQAKTGRRPFANETAEAVECGGDHSSSSKSVAVMKVTKVTNGPIDPLLTRVCVRA